MPAVKSSPQRKYALTKVKPGDYLLPSNDGQTLWRIAEYEDGPSYGLEDMERDRKFWGIWRWTGLGSFDSLPDDFLEWDRWEMFDQWYDTRSSAIDGALKAESRSGNGRITP